MDDLELDFTDIIPPELSAQPRQSRISLPPDYTTTNHITNELFQVTSSLREKNRQNPKRLNNDKIQKMIQDLEKTDYELDDVVRTRVFKGRLKNRHSFTQVRPDLNEYFDENKENRDKPSKVTKKKSPVPILQPITNTIKRSPKRLCLPKHSVIAPRKPALKADRASSIFLMESSSGLVNDATKYATELNSSQCDDFPLPEHENEVVQIPTNEDDNPKMAIIRMFKTKRFDTKAEGEASGFYNEKEFQKYKGEQDNGVSVVSQSVNGPTAKKTVKWATNLEW
ncbi:conserved hypothetical protein [Candida dubliniensis CD36]|uniref:Uncharacterized protein n=1 Tax=Candida dubliniensis (strain CD36 / ATCC MYA-646 / CBS 7987 / NCPF 3949 / NRRL Y-17841) TaxID=573826 RepID=B9WIA3_CANDC|nr:conserved hypothetical protein [Candida dubliniensis CD36]CAX40965.1 conserved hypothetical protein [Candida dubliniensis CD36]